MRDRFDYETYDWLLTRLSATNRPMRFADVKSGFPSEPFFILRHDVDYSPAAALTLARREAERAVRATYFLLPNGIYYNLLSPEHAGLAREIAALGHEVGLHYDVSFLRGFPQDQWLDFLEQQAKLLGRLAGTSIQSIAMHQPGLNGTDPFRGATRFLNAYDDRFFLEMPYVSDSCRAWRDSAWELLSAARLPPRLQLALHPINWGDGDRDRVRIFADVHGELRASIGRAERELLGKIAQHRSVREHEARAVVAAAEREGSGGGEAP